MADSKFRVVIQRMYLEFFQLLFGAFTVDQLPMIIPYSLVHILPH